MIWIVCYSSFLLHKPLLFKPSPYIHLVWIQLGSYGTRYYIIFTQREWEEPVKWSMFLLPSFHIITLMVVMYDSPTR